MTSRRERSHRSRASGTHVALVLAAGLLTAAVACGPGAKGESLVELEALREANYTRTIRTDPAEVENPRVQEIRQSAHNSIRESDRWYNAAIEAWESRESDQSEELARQGTLLYRAAEAYSRAADARQRIEQANANFQAQLERRNRYNDMVAANEEVLELLAALQALYEQTEDCRAELLGYSAEQEAEIRAYHAVREARFQQREAENRKANDFAETLFQEGVRLLTNAAEYIDAQQFDLAFDTAQLASTRFREAMTQSEAEFQEVQNRFLNRSANQSLFEEAANQFGDNVFVDTRGVVVVVTDLFPDRRSDIRDSKTYLLDELAELIRSNRRFDVLIEGHTSDQGSRESNLATSRGRAEAVRDYLIARDARRSRLSVVGLGEDYPRFDNRTRDGRSDNNRVEVVFLFD